MYAVIQSHKSHNRSVQLNGVLSADPAHGETPPPVTGGKNPCRRHLYRAEIQRREEKRETKKHPKVIPSPYLHFQTHTPMTIILVYLGVGHCRNCQGGRASAHDLASMGASAASIGCSRQLYTSIASRVVASH